MPENSASPPVGTRTAPNDTGMLTHDEVEFIERRVLESFREQLVNRRIIPIPIINREFSLNWRTLAEPMFTSIVSLDGEGWPQASIQEINNGRAYLQSHGYVTVEPVLFATTDLIHTLDAVMANTDVMWRDFLIRNGLISGIQEVSNTESGAILVVPIEETADIIPFNRYVPINIEAWSTLRETTERVNADSTKRGGFTEEVKEKAWELLREYMNETQHTSFAVGSKIELQNITKTHRILVDNTGEFTILSGDVGAGIVAASGNIRSYDYPLGDEIATFLDWFTYKTEELISEWRCGTYGIVKGDQRR